MRPQARPFSVETNSRKRTAPPAISASARQDDWNDIIPPHDVPARDVHGGLAEPAGPSEARREAERVFARVNGHARPSESQDEAAPGEPLARAPEAPAPRVLPDLLAAARDQERTMVEKPKRTRVLKATKVKRSRKTKGPGLRVGAPAPAPPESATVSTGHAQSAMPQGRRVTDRASKLPPGQRWRERRLPRVCWNR